MNWWTGSILIINENCCILKSLTHNVSINLQTYTGSFGITSKDSFYPGVVCKHPMSLFDYSTMIYLTFTYSRDVFNGPCLRHWVEKYFKSSDYRFMGFEYGQRHPTIRVSLSDFEKHKDKIPTFNLVRARGEFDMITQLTLGVRNFDNDLRRMENYERPLTSWQTKKQKQYYEKIDRFMQ